MELAQSISNGRFVQAKDHDTISLLGRIFSQELEHLRKASSTVEYVELTRRPSPRTSTGLQSPSGSLFGSDFAEINRTLLSVLALKWILNDDYKRFTCAQNVQTKLSFTSFTKLREFFSSRLKSDEDVYDLIVSLVLSDLGKDAALLDSLHIDQSATASDINHDEVAYIAAKNNYFPMLADLPEDRRADVLLGLKFGASVNVPQLVQAECVPGSLKGTSMMKNRTRAFGIKFMEVLLDVAGASGHADARGSTSMTETVAQSFMCAHEALEEFINDKITLRECYDRNLDHRREMLRKEGFQFSLSTPLYDRALTRLLAMGRVDNKMAAASFLAAFESLPEQIRISLAEGLNVDGINDGLAIVPYYAPALLALIQQHASSPDVSGDFQSALASLFRFLCRVLGGTRPLPDQPSCIIERNVAFARYIVGSELFYDDPTILDALDIPPLPIAPAD